MLRYKLHTLLIVLALGPPVIAGGWREYMAYRQRESLLSFLQAASERARTMRTRPAMRLVVVPSRAHAFADPPPGWSDPLRDAAMPDDSK